MKENFRKNYRFLVKPAGIFSAKIKTHLQNALAVNFAGLILPIE
jgi:hypothetical protein